jgi:hypothetical protein
MTLHIHYTAVIYSKTLQRVARKRVSFYNERFDILLATGQLSVAARVTSRRFAPHQNKLTVVRGFTHSLQGTVSQNRPRTPSTSTDNPT